MEPRGNKALSYLLAGLFGVILPHVSLGAESPQASQGAVDLLIGASDAGGAGLLPEKAETLGIKSEVAKKFYERTIAGSLSREGTLDWNLLMRLIKDNKSPKILKLLPGIVVEFAPKSYEPIKVYFRKKPNTVHRYRWTVRLTSQGKDVGEGIFIVDEKLQKMSATIDYKDKVYKIVPLKNGNVRIYELDPRRFPEEHPEAGTSSSLPDTLGKRVTHDEQDTAPHDSELGGPSESESTGEPCVIDMLVLYTQDAEEPWLAEGEDISEEIYRAVDITNTAFTNSNINAVVQFADIKQVPRIDFQESGALDTDLGKLMDNAHFGSIARKWRDETKADLVSLWVSGGDWCGASPYFPRRGPTEEEGFSVVVVSCAANSKSLAHEIGHNLGVRHTRWDEGVPDDDPEHNFGHLSKASRVRTIMASNRECASVEIYCRRESQYSNPEVPYPGIATWSGVIMGGPKAADNSHYLNNTACKAAKYRSPSDQ
jgi:Metallo-peptidase family M12